MEKIEIVFRFTELPNGTYLCNSSLSDDIGVLGDTKEEAKDNYFKQWNKKVDEDNKSIENLPKNVQIRRFVLTEITYEK